MIADEANMNWKTVRLIPTEELGTRTICACAQESLLTSKRITVKLQPPYSPDLAACYFFLFQKVKSAVKGRHFESTEDIQRAVTQVLTL
jgi:transposase